MGFKVLIVDDSAVMRSLIRKTLEATGLPLESVQEAADGAAGLDAAIQEHFDLAIIDLNMPVMNGEEMIDRLREDPSRGRTAVLVVSTERGQPRLDRLGQKVDGFVHKPFTAEILAEKIGAVMQEAG